jgi:hypothetical protein
MDGHDVLMRKLRGRLRGNDYYNNTNTDVIKENQDKAVYELMNKSRIHHKKITSGKNPFVSIPNEILHAMSNSRAVKREYIQEKNRSENQPIDILDLRTFIELFIETKYLKQFEEKMQSSKVPIYRYIMSLDKYTLKQLSEKLNHILDGGGIAVNSSDYALDDGQDYNVELEKEGINLKELKQICKSIKKPHHYKKKSKTKIYT